MREIIYFKNNGKNISLLKNFINAFILSVVNLEQTGKKEKLFSKTSF